MCDGCGRPYQKKHPRQRYNRCEGCTPTAAPDPRHQAEYLRNREIVLASGDPCFWCGAEATTADHVIAVADGSGSNLGNLVPACAPCNSRRGGKRSNRTRSGAPPVREPVGAAAMRLV